MIKRTYSIEPALMLEVLRQNFSDLPGDAVIVNANMYATGVLEVVTASSDAPPEPKPTALLHVAAAEPEAEKPNEPHPAKDAKSKGKKP